MRPSVERARDLRRDQSNAEKIFWRRVRNRGLGGLKFKRQVPIGPYTADFLIDEARLVVELDGDQHGLDEGLAHDAARDAYLRGEGFEVLRVWNRDIYDRIVDILDHVLYVAQMRIAELESADPSPENAAHFRRRMGPQPHSTPRER